MDIGVNTNDMIETKAAAAIALPTMSTQDVSEIDLYDEAA